MEVGAAWPGGGRWPTDLIIGGYLTGLIYHYKSVGVLADGTPELTDAGHLVADGEIIDVGWAAAPTFGDFRGTGLPSMIAGMMDPPGLQYYENVGARLEPELARKSLEIEGPEGEELALGLTYPCAWDLDGDGRLDLVVGSVDTVHLLTQVESTELAFRSAGPLRQPWGAHQFRAADGFRDDRGPAFIAASDGATLMVHRRDPASGMFVPERALTVQGEAIYRQYPDRDPWNAACLRDLDGDGEMELLMGDSVGNVWLHRSLEEEFESGLQLMLEDGRPVNVGLDANAEVTDWTTHVGDPSDPVGADVDADWDGDGEIEIFASWSSGDIKLFKQSAAGWKGTDISTSWIPYPHPIVIDVTGSGAPDLILSGSYGFVHLFRRAFVEHGYNEGRVTSGA